MFKIFWSDPRQVPPPDTGGIVKIAICISKCLITHIPTNPISLVGFMACCLGNCICTFGRDMTETYSGGYKLSLRDRMQEYVRNWNRKSYNELGKNIRGSMEWATLYGNCYWWTVIWIKCSKPTVRMFIIIKINE